MLAEYSGVLLLLIVALIVAGVMLLVQQLLSPKREFPEKQEPFECGEHPIVSPYQRFNIKFYMVAVSFIIFDVEVVFLYPWSIVFRDLGWYGLIVMIPFLLVLILGLAYEWLKGGLEWE